MDKVLRYLEIGMNVAIIVMLALVLSQCNVTGSITTTPPPPKEAKACGFGSTIEAAADLCWAAGCSVWTDVPCRKIGGVWVCGCGEVPSVDNEFKTVKARQRKGE